MFSYERDVVRIEWKLLIALNRGLPPINFDYLQGQGEDIPSYRKKLRPSRVVRTLKHTQASDVEVRNTR